MNIWTGGMTEIEYFGYHISLNRVFGFKQAGEEVAVNCLKNIDISYNVSLLDSNLSKHKQVRQLLKRGSLPDICGNVIVFSGSSLVKQKGVFYDKALEFCEQAIARLRVLIFQNEGNHPENLICPITLALFEDPVIDNNGQTYERSAIEEQRRLNNNLNLYRQTITSLTSNFTVKSLADEVRLRQPIPLLASMQGKKIGEDRIKADRFLELAKIYGSEEDYQNALEMYVKAYLHTDKIEDYEAIPPLFLSMKEPLKAALAYLYLAKRQIEEGHSAEASLDQALKLAPQEESVIAAQAHYLAFQGKQTEAAKRFCEHAYQLAGQGKESATWWEYAISSSPDLGEIYEKAPPFLDDEAKVRLFLIGFAHFYKDKREYAMELHRKASLLQPKNPHIHLALLNRLEKKDPEKVPLYQVLAALFSEREEVEAACIYFDKVIARKQEPQYLQEYIRYLIMTEKKEKAVQTVLSFLDLLYPQGEEGIEKAMAEFGREIPFLEHLLSTHLKEQNLQGLERLIPELAAKYKYIKKFEGCERIYRIAHERLKDFESSFKLAQVLADQKKSEESGRLYFELSTEAHNQLQFDKVARCIKELEHLKPFFNFSSQEEQALLVQKCAVEMFQQIEQNRQEIRLLKQQQEDSIRNLIQEVIRPLQEGLKIALNAAGRSTALIIAAGEGDLATIKLLLGQGLDVNREDHDKKTALICAVEQGRIDAARLLLENGAEIEGAKRGVQKPSEWGDSALKCALVKGNLEMIRFLVSYSIENFKNEWRLSWRRYGKDLLHMAVETGNFGIVRFLLQEAKESNLRCDISENYENGKSCINYAIDQGNLNMVTKLFEEISIGKSFKRTYGAYDEPRGYRSYILWAIKKDKPEIFKYLYKHNTDTINMTVDSSDFYFTDIFKIFKNNNYRHSADLLELASFWGALDIVSILFEVPNRGRFSLDRSLAWAAYAGHDSIMQKLIEQKANVEGAISALSWIQDGQGLEKAKARLTQCINMQNKNILIDK